MFSEGNLLKKFEVFGGSLKMFSFLCRLEVFENFVVSKLVIKRKKLKLQGRYTTIGYSATPV